MNKLLSTPLAIAVSAAFVMSVSLTSCANNPPQAEATTQQNLSPEEAARIAAEKKKAAEKKRAQQLQSAPRPSGGCGH